MNMFSDAFPDDKLWKNVENDVILGGVWGWGGGTPQSKNQRVGLRVSKKLSVRSLERPRGADQGL